MMYCKEINKEQKFDVVVCGGGFSGFAAAYSAAREELNVLLIEKSAALGGVGTCGLVNHLLGERSIRSGVISKCVGGIFDTLEKRLIDRGFGLELSRENLDLSPHGWYSSLGIGLIFDNEGMKLVLEEMATEVGVNILYTTQIVDAVCENGKITSLILVNKSGFSKVNARYFIDATGDGDIFAMSGCSFKSGDEDGKFAAASLEMHLENVDSQALTNYMKETGDLRFRNIIEKLKKSGEWPFPYEIFISVMLMEKDVFMINTIRQVGVDGTCASSISDATITGRAENFKLWEIAKKHFPGFENSRIRAIAPSIGIRETRRLCGEYILSPEDIINGKEFYDSIAVSGYGFDLPHPLKPSFQPLEKAQRKSPYTEIPYRCLLPKEISNLLVAGRCISAQRDALGPIRVMGVCIAQGEAAGIAAMLAVKNNTSFKNVDIKKLKSLLKERGAITCRDEVEEL